MLIPKFFIPPRYDTTLNNNTNAINIALEQIQDFSPKNVKHIEIRKRSSNHMI